jgi:hypothetical protein
LEREDWYGKIIEQASSVNTPHPSLALGKRKVTSSIEFVYTS